MLKEFKGKLIENILAQAKLYLQEADEFYPFGTVINKEQNIQPVSFYLGEEYPDSTELMGYLEKAIQKGIAQGDYLVAAMGVDVYLTVDSTKHTALQIRFYDSQSSFVEYYLYSKVKDAYTFEPYNDPNVAREEG